LGESIRPQSGRVEKGSQVLRFWRLVTKGEKVLSTKQKDRTTILKFSKKSFLFQLVSYLTSMECGNFSFGISVSLKMDFQLVSHLASKFQISIEISIGIISSGIYFKKGEIISKTLLKAKGRISSWGAFI
jgi:hypothetical protein